MKRGRHDTRDWVVNRRERTRRLIELGGLVAKAGLDELAKGDRALIFGALLGVAEMLHGEDSDEIAMLWRRRGKRAFESEAKASPRG